MRFNATSCGIRIRELRNRKKLTQMQLSEELKITFRYLSRMENGISVASVDLLVDIANYFGVTLDYLLMGKENKNSELKHQIQKVIDTLEDLLSAV